MLVPYSKTLLVFSITKGRSALKSSVCLLSVTGSSAGALNPMSLSLMLVSGIPSYALSFLSALLSAVVCTPILNAFV